MTYKPGARNEAQRAVLLDELREVAEADRAANPHTRKATCITVHTPSHQGCTWCKP